MSFPFLSNSFVETGTSSLLSFVGSGIPQKSHENIADNTPKKTIFLISLRFVKNLFSLLSFFADVPFVVSTKEDFFTDLRRYLFRSLVLKFFSSLIFAMFSIIPCKIQKYD